MSRYYYDLHIHSCLSPCADDDMTVNNIAGMAALKGLQIVALTDHNTCGNCRSFFTACRRQGLIPVAGMELTTAEEIHMVCLFEDLEQAEAFEEDLRPFRLPVKNKPEIFGNQLYLDELAQLKPYADEGKVLIIAPKTIYNMGTLTKDKGILQKLYDDAVKQAEAIPGFLNS